MRREAFGGEECCPQLLRDMISKPFIKTIVIKGAPGAGKTTLSLEIMNAIGSGIYVSTRVAIRELVEQHPYMKPMLERGELEDVSFEDLRLGSAADIMEIVLRAIRKRRGVVVLDSWDTLANELDPLERLKAEKSLTAMVEPREVKLIFVKESAETSSIDYLADAVIALKDEEFRGFRIRYLVWEKIRGTEIPQKRYLFTLHGGRFKLLVPTEVRRPRITEEFRPLGGSFGSYSTGNEDLDRILGGIQKGSGLLITLGRNVHSHAPLPIILSIAINFVMNGGSCVILPLAGVRTDVLTSVRRVLPPEIRDLMAVIRLESSKHSTHGVDFSSPWKAKEIVLKVVEEIRSRSERNRCMIVMGTDFMEYFFPERSLLTTILGVLDYIKDTEDIAVFLARDSTRCRNELEDLLELSVRLDMICRTLVFYSIKPPSGIYHMEIPEELRIQLTPIV